ncbi:MAG: anion permease [Acidobacteria bacterium]|nr:anion permease [Acidobacteriota bacterium]
MSNSTIDNMAMRGTVSAKAEPTMKKYVGWALAICVPALLWFLPLNIDPRAKHALAITVFMILAWITEVMEPGLVGLTGCFLFWSLGVVARFSQAFGGFSEDTPWFLFGATLFGVMVTESGLARRMAYFVMSRVGTSYSALLFGLIATDFLLTFLVPSGLARVVIMAAIALGLLEVFGLGPGSNVGRGMFIILTYCAGIFDKMIIAGAASILARGLIERFGNVSVYYSQWFLAYLPCDIITILVCWRLILWMFPPEKKEMPGGTEFLRSELRKSGPMSPAEKKAAALMVLAIGLWLTDFAHHLAPSLIGLGVALIAALPFMGILKIEQIRKVNFLPIIFVGTAISMGQVLVETKTLDILTRVMFGWMSSLVTSVSGSAVVLYWTAFVYHIFLASEISMLGTSMPLVMQFAHTQGLNPLAIGMIWTFAAGGKIFVYQSAVMIVGYSYGYFQAKDFFKVGLVLTAVESIILLLLVPLYWPLIGIL